MEKKLSTDSYKGVRDFYPDDMAIQQYIFTVWSQTAESFGYARYDASVLEPAELYKRKSSEEIVSEQTYTFTDRGDREVTLRPEMTPTVARMIAKRRRELSFPVRWYSIPNLFRYERPQRGRLREHWQLNCDLFGGDDISADIEIIAIANQVLRNFGAEQNNFEIRINHRQLLIAGVLELASRVGTTLDETQIQQTIRLLDKRSKIEPEKFNAQLTTIVGAEVSKSILSKYGSKDMKEAVKTSAAYAELTRIQDGLKKMGIPTKLDVELARGFDYYTGMIFEIFDVSGENNRSIAGGGRYDNLTSLFDDEPIAAVGFAMGDVTTRNVLETHDLLTADITSPTIMVLPTDVSHNIEAQLLAQEFRMNGLSVSADISSKKVGKKISNASDALVDYVLVLGEDEIKNKTYTVKNLIEGSERSGTLPELIEHVSKQS